MRVNEPGKDGRYVLTAHVRVHTGADGGTVLDLRKNRCYHLNAVACIMLNDLFAGKPAAQVAGSLALQTCSDPDRVADDVEQFIQTLLERGWIINENRGRSTNLIHGLRRVFRRTSEC